MCVCPFKRLRLPGSCNFQSLGVLRPKQRTSRQPTSQTVTADPVGPDERGSLQPRQAFHSFLACPHHPSQPQLAPNLQSQSHRKDPDESRDTHTPLTVILRPPSKTFACLVCRSMGPPRPPARQHPQPTSLHTRWIILIPTCTCRLAWYPRRPEVAMHDRSIHDQNHTKKQGKRAERGKRVTVDPQPRAREPREAKRVATVHKHGHP